MAIIYEVTISPAEENHFHITWLNKQNGKKDSFVQTEPRISIEDVNKLQYDPEQGLDIGSTLFRFLDGEAHHLQMALAEAGKYGEPLILQLKDCQEISGQPFELLAKDGNYLLPYRLHLVHRLSSWGVKKNILPENRPLRLLFMACSPLDVQEETDYEKAEEHIFQVTADIDMEMEVEDSGSLEGLRLKLERKHYDVVHLSGYVNIDDRGRPFFIMENETGDEHKVSPHELWNNGLIENPPRLLFLSYRLRDTKYDTTASLSLARTMVENHNAPAVLVWSRPVSNELARHVMQIIYRKLSLGKSILEAVQRSRNQLEIDFPAHSHTAWPFLRLYSTAQKLGAIVKEGKKKQPRFIIKGLPKGFVGRRRQLQHSLRSLRHNIRKIGLFLHGTAGLGKSCLAGKICERLCDHTLITVRGKLDSTTMESALKDAFAESQDKKGKQIQSQQKRITEKLTDLCVTSFKEKNYLLLLDDFEENLEGGTEGKPDWLLPKTAEILRTLLHYLPMSGKMTQLIITSRYLFSLSEQAHDLVEERLEPICLTGFRAVEQRKKAQELKNIAKFNHQAGGEDLVAVGHGNPSLMEWLDRLAGQVTEKKLSQLVEPVKVKQEEFIRSHRIRELLRYGGDELKSFLTHLSVFRQPVSTCGIALVAEKDSTEGWQELLHRGISLSLVEHDQARGTYRVTPLLREELFQSLTEHRVYHEAAFAYYKSICDTCEPVDPALIEEWIFHALDCGEEDVASEQASRLMDYLASRLKFQESRRIGEWVLNAKNRSLSTTHDASLLNELAKASAKQWNHRKACEYFQQALKIDLMLFGSLHINVARDLNNLGNALTDMGDYRKAFDYFQQALDIWMDVYGEKHPQVAVGLNNLASIYLEIGNPQEALYYFQEAHIILLNSYGERHPKTAGNLLNLGSTWIKLDKEEKALDYFQQALNILKEVVGDNHPDYAAGLSNLGLAWSKQDHYTKASGYFRQALGILKEVYGDMHPQVGIALINLGSNCLHLGERQKAVEYFRQALGIFRDVYGENHAHTAAVKGKIKALK